jgi:hypothetical protein
MLVRRKKSNSAPFILWAAESIDFIGDREHAEPVGIVTRQGEAQDCQVPGPQRPGLPLDWTLLIHCDALLATDLKVTSFGGAGQIVSMRIRKRMGSRQLVGKRNAFRRRHKLELRRLPVPWRDLIRWRKLLAR